MGINHLWKILAPAAQKKSLSEIAVREGFESNRHGTGVVVIGIDASTWFYECQVFSSRGRQHVQAGQNPELRVLFYRLAALSRLPISAVFVFDGDRRPKTKRGKAVRIFPHWLTTSFRKLAEAYGFYCHTAPGEAEAELAYLNQILAIDSVLTSDSDIFLFGATHVIRSPQDSSERDSVEVYTDEGFAGQSNQTLSSAGFLFIAIMCGGDYDPVGLRGFGRSMAKALASGPLALSLYHSATNLSENDLRNHLLTWRLDLEDELLNDPHGALGRTYPHFANKIPLTFPDPKVLRQYTHPLTSSINLGSSTRISNWFNLAFPNTVTLALLCDQYFGWGPDILNRLSTNVWDGYFIRRLVQASRSCLELPGKNLGPNAIRHITSVREKISTSSAFPSYRVEVFLGTLPVDVRQALKPEIVIHGGASIISTSLWVPGPILSAAASKQVAEFTKTHYNALFPRNVYTPVLSDIEIIAGDEI